jgi:hypothetical protein
MLESVIALLMIDGYEVQAITDVTDEDHVYTRIAREKKGEQLAEHLEKLNAVTRCDDEAAANIMQLREKTKEQRLIVTAHLIRSHISEDIKADITKTYYRLYDNADVKRAVTAYRWSEGMGSLDDIFDWDHARTIGNRDDFKPCWHLEVPKHAGLVNPHGDYRPKEYKDRSEYLRASTRFHHIWKASNAMGKLINSSNTDVSRFNSRKIHAGASLLELFGLRGEGNSAKRIAIDYEKHRGDIFRLVEQYNGLASQLDRINTVPYGCVTIEPAGLACELLRKCFNLVLNSAGGLSWLEWVPGKEDDLTLNIDTLDFVRFGRVPSAATVARKIKEEQAKERADEFGDANYIIKEHGVQCFYIKSKKTGEMKESSVKSNMYDHPELLALYKNNFKHKKNPNGLEYTNTN